MVEFLETFDVERARLLKVLDALEEVWGRFQEGRALNDVDGQGDSLIDAEFAAARADLSSAQFTIGVFGLIKRGKSTLMNALIGREVSSMHVTPETAVPVYVQHSENPTAVVHFSDGRSENVAVDEVTRFTSQKYNEHNTLGVTHVEQFVPVPFLANGTRLIDTPGLDDAEADEVYTERTLQELDVVDAGIIVFLSPPTVGATEMSFLEDVASRDLAKSFLICNMYPQHFHDPSTRKAVLEYVGKRIVEACKRGGMRGQVRLYPVCALEAWNARVQDDPKMWKRSGADRLLRDLESHLGEVTGQKMITDAADRVAKVAEMAESEVRVRMSLLDDAAKLDQHKERLDQNIRQLEKIFDAAVEAATAELMQLKLRIRGQVLRPFTHARSGIDAAESFEELEAWSRRFKREVEVAGETASRQFAEGFQAVVSRVRTALEQRFEAVMSDIAPNIPKVNLSTSAMIGSTEQYVAQADTKSADTKAIGAGAAAGAASGSVAFFLGSALLGPIGLLGGALVGYKMMGSLGSKNNLKTSKEQIKERLEDVSRELLEDFDKQVEEAAGTLAAAVGNRRAAFASDLYQQFETVEELAKDTAASEEFRIQARRFAAAFAGCAVRARSVVDANAA